MSNMQHAIRISSRSGARPGIRVPPRSIPFLESERRHEMNNDRFHWKPRHLRRGEGMDFQRNRTGERSLAFTSAPFSYNLSSTSLSFSVLFLHFRIPRRGDGRETDFMMVTAGGDDDDNDDAWVVLVSLCHSLVWKSF